MADSEPVTEAQIIESRKQKLAAFFKKTSWWTYFLVALVVWLAVKIRTRNLPGLRDVTTKGWTLGPDLDPFLFLRWAKYIVENGSIMANDAMRNVPLGYDTSQEHVLLSYLIAWFHKIAVIFGSVSVDNSAALFPVFMFALTIIAFFLMTRIMFRDMLGEKKASLTAIIASFFLSVIPALLPRTIAGIPEKESAGFFFLFAAFYCFIAAWKGDTLYKKYGFAFAAALMTALMALVWGGYIYIFVTIGLTTLILFLFGQVNKEKANIYGIWFFVSLAVIFISTTRYPLKEMVANPTTGIAFFTLAVILIHGILFKTKIRHYIEKKEKIAKLPKPALSIMLAVALALLFVMGTEGPYFILERITAVKNALVTPVADRIGVTVAENKQPYYTEWSGNFGPNWQGIPVIFWLFVIGSVYLFYHMHSHFFRKERFIFTLSYAFFLVAAIFSRKDPSSILNGVNQQSLLLYLLGFVVLIGVLGFYYFRLHKKGEAVFHTIDAGALLLFAFFFFSIVSARSAVRLIMVLVPSASIMASYLGVVLFTDAKKAKTEIGKMVLWIAFILTAIALLWAGYNLYKASEGTASGYAPYSYTYQWQKAMAWVRENTQENAVFGHWWDYGYWVQSMGNRATVLDGGNAIGYWDYLMGRHGLTARDTDVKETLEFLYAHNTTHFLIDPTDIGKYPAFSSIGSDKSYDRRSWMQFFGRERIVNETKNSVFYLYSSGGFPLDADVIYSQNGNLITLPEGRAAVGAVIVEMNRSGFLAGQPRAVFLNQKNRNSLPEQYVLPLRYAYQKGKFSDFGSGVEAGVYLMPQFKQQGSTPVIDEDSILIYLSNKTVKSQLVRLYLYKEDNPHFKLVHNEDSDFVAQLKSYNLLKEDEDIVYAQGFVGPIRIWEIKYPKDVQFNPVYNLKNFPRENPLVSV